MHCCLSTTTTFALLANLSAVLSSNEPAIQADELRKLHGEWLYVEDRTVGREVEKQGPPMSTKFSLRVEKDAVVMPRTGGREERISLDGSVIKEAGESSTTQRSGEWKDGVLKYQVEVLRVADKSRAMLIRRQFRITPDGLQVQVELGGTKQVALYRHPKDIALPTPAKATIGDMKWLAGAWIGTRGKSSIEERWSPPLGGAMLGVSRTVSRSKNKMVGFEYLRIIERDGGLVYVAQPGGRAPTEFTLTKLDKSSAVFMNPRHDYPQRIVYELSAEGNLTATIGFAKGGEGRSFEFKAE